MAKKTPAIVDINAYFKALEHPMKEQVLRLRQLILNTDSQIAEQVKWNSPSFYYTGEMEDFDPKKYLRDIVVLNLHKPNLILMVFPTGANIKNHEGVLEGNYEDGRRLISIKSADDLDNKSNSIQSVLKSWLSQVV